MNRPPAAAAEPAALRLETAELLARPPERKCSAVAVVMQVARARGLRMRRREVGEWARPRR